MLHAGEPQLALHLERLLQEDATAEATLEALAPEEVSDLLRSALPALLPEGQRLGPYRLLSLLGSGGMGRVFLAERCDGELAQRVAIKLIRPDRLEPAMLARFSTERRLLAALRHPGICAFLDAGTASDGTPYVVMEHVEGIPLLEYCSRERLRIPQRLQVLRQILAAVVHAHSRLVVHRDIKPSNVLVTPDGQAKLLDFGIAKSLTENDTTQTATIDRFLTPQNAAPELLLGEPTGIACDIYALGALAYELLSGAPPFRLSGLRGPEIERQILTMPPLAMSHQVSDDAAGERQLADATSLARCLKGDLDTIVLRCLRKAPGDRYSSVAELDADIERHLVKRPIRARHGERLYRASRFVARHRLAVGLSATFLALLVTATFALLVQSMQLASQSAELMRQRNLAVLERDHAQQVVTVLRDAFVAADPTRTAGAQLRIRDVLDAARPRVQHLAESQPELFVVLADTLAGVELDLASDAQAASLALQALSHSDSPMVDPQLTRRLRIVAARALTGLGDMDAAQAQLNLFDETDRSAPDWLVAQARLAFHRSQIDYATDLLGQAITLLSDRPADDELATDARWQLAEAQRWGGRRQQALATLQETLEWQLGGIEEHHPRVLLTQLRLLNVQAESGTAEAVLESLERVTTLIVSQYGQSSAMAAAAHNAYGMALRRAAHRERAIEQLRLTRAIWRDILGDGHANSLRVGRNLAMALAESPESLDEAEHLMWDVLAHAEQHFEPDRPLVIAMRISLANLLGTRERWNDALTLMASESAARGSEVTNVANLRLQAAEVERILEGAGCREPRSAGNRPCRTVVELLHRLQDRIEQVAIAEQPS